MVDALQEIDVSCPYCGAAITLLLDVTQGPCDYIEDCGTCCAPIEVMLRFDETGEPQLWLRSGDE